MPYSYQALDYIKENVDNSASDKFTDLEYEKFRRVVDYMETTHYSSDKLKEGHTDFHRWFTEFDRRRGTNFLETFPEYKKFYLDCKNV
jgi:hypothetical protein